MTTNPEGQSGTMSPPSERPRTPESVRIASYTLRVICKECLETPANLVENYSSGDTICGSCGLVLMEHQIDMRPEWRTFAGDDDNGPDPNRCGDAANALLDGNQLDTSIAFASRPSTMAIGIARAQNKMHKDTANKTLLAAYADIGAYCESMRLTNMVTESAKEYYKKAHDSKVVRGRDNVTVIASCIFLACRWCGVPRTFNEVMSITKCAKKDISRTFRILSKFFRKEETDKIEAATASGSVEPMLSNAPTSSGTALSVVPRICSHLQLGHKCEQIAGELVANVQRREFLGGRAPITIAATVVFFASHLCKDPKTFHQICEMTGIAPRTIKSAYKELYKRRIALVNPEWIVDGINLLPIP